MEGVFAVIARAGGSDGFRESAGCGIHAAEVNLLFRFPCSEHAGLAFGESFRAHDACSYIPLRNVGAAESVSMIAGNQKIHIAVHHLFRGAE